MLELRQLFRFHCGSVSIHPYVAGGPENSPSDNDNLLVRLRDAALANRVSLSRFDIGFCSADVYCAVFFKGVKLMQGVQSGCVLNVTSSDIKAGCFQLELIWTYGLIKINKKQKK